MVARRSRTRGSQFISARPLYALQGLNEDENPRALEPGELTRAENVARNGNLTGMRPGVTYGDSDYTAAHGDGEDVQGIVEYSYAGGGTRDLIVVTNGKVLDTYNNTLDKATNSVTISAGQNNQWTFAVFQDKLFAAGGDTSADDTWYYDGTNPLNVLDLKRADLTTSTTKPKYIFEKWNFLFAAGFSGTSFDDNPMIVRYCDYGTDATDATNWPATNVIPGQLLNENFGLGTYGSEYITGIGEFSGKDADFLLILTNKRIFVFGQNDPGLITGSETAFAHVSTIPIGCVSQNAFVTLGAESGDVVYLSKDGVHSLARSRQYGDNETQYLSWKIRNTWQTLNQSRLDKAWGAYWPSEGMAIFSVATGSNTTNDLLLVMDVKGAQEINAQTVRWYKWKLNGVTPNVLKLARGSDGKPYVYVGGTAGQVCRFERDNYQDLTSSGTISMDLITSHDDFGIPSKDKRLGDCFIMIRGSGGGTVAYTSMREDGRVSGTSQNLSVPSSASTWGPTGSAVWGQSKWGGENAIARHRVSVTGSSVTAGHRFQRTGASKPVFIGLIDQQVELSGATQDADGNAG